MNIVNLLGEYEYGLAYRTNKTAYNIIKPNSRYWYADPIPYEINSTTYVFMEAYDKKEKKGKIAVSELDSNNKLTPPSIIIDEDFHMSFPYIFTYNNSVYMMPETSASHSIRIYRMEESVHKWNLFYSFPTDIHLSDTIVVPQAENLLLLSCEVNPQNGLECRYINFVLSDLEQSPKLNLVFQDNKYSMHKRNGGGIVNYNNKKCRVIQHSTKELYGKYITLHQCAESGDFLNNRPYTSFYVEDFHLDLKGNYLLLGTHTYGIIHNFEVVDFYSKRISASGLLYKIMRICKKLCPLLP